MSFQIHALPAELYSHFFAFSDDALRARNMRRIRVESCPGTPCRVSLEDAQVGETVLLLNHEHQPANTPHRASHAIFIRDGAEQARPEVGEVPGVIRSRLISLRLFDAADMMVDADVFDGKDAADAIDRAFADPAIAYAHLHNAKPGCFAASVTRAETSADIA